MPISIIDNFDVNAPKNIDGRLGPYDTTASAKAAIDETTQRYLGLTVVVTGSGNLEEYWFQNGITDSDLVLKPSSAGEGGIFKQTGSYYATTNDLQVTGSFEVGSNTYGRILSVSSSVALFAIQAGGDYMFTIGQGGSQDVMIGGFGDYNNYASSTFHKSITASSDISASGNLFASASDGTGISHVALYNTSSGQFFYTASNTIGGGGGTAGTLQQVMNAGSTASVSTDIEIENGGGRIFFDGIDESISITSSGSAGTGAIRLNSWNGTGSPISASLGVVAGHIYFQGSNLGNPSAGDVLVSTNTQGRVKWTGSSAVGGGGTDPKYLVYETGSGTDSIKPSHGNGNVSSGLRSTVAGGANNEATNSNTFVGGGEENCALQTKTAVLGGEKNKACQGYSVAGGGYLNTANGCLSGVWSGCVNTAGGNSSAILGGRNNEAGGDCSIVGGGSTNSANCTTSGIFSGCTNDVNGNSSAILGGETNEASGDCSIVVGGQLNCAQQTHDFIGGGCNNKTVNTAGSFGNAIVGGRLNEILDAAGNETYLSFIGGGEGNKIDAHQSSIVGGINNHIDGQNLNPVYSFIGGGFNNYISSSASNIVGGTQNKIHVGATNSSIVGGVSNRISGSGAQLSNYSAILGGCGNVLKHEKSFIIGANITSTANCTTFMNNVTLEGNISSSSTGSFGYVILDYDTMPTSNPNVKGAVYRSGNTLLISAG